MNANQSHGKIYIIRDGYIPCRNLTEQKIAHQTNEMENAEQTEIVE